MAKTLVDMIMGLHHILVGVLATILFLYMIMNIVHILIIPFKIEGGITPLSAYFL